MERFLNDIVALIVAGAGILIAVMVLNSIISVAQTAKLLLAEQKKTNAILTAAHGLDGANARCAVCKARIAIDADKIGHATRCPACGKVCKPEAL